MDNLKTFCENPLVRCVCMAVVIALLIWCLSILMDLKKAQETENFAYTSGAGMRFLSAPTATDQGRYTTGYNSEKRDVLQKLLAPSEQFISKRALNQEEILAKHLYNEDFHGAPPDEQVINELQSYL